MKKNAKVQNPSALCSVQLNPLGFVFQRKLRLRRQVSIPGHQMTAPVRAEEHRENAPGGVDHTARLREQKIVVKVREPEHESEIRIEWIAQIGARIGIEEALQFLVAALQPDLGGLVRIFSQKDSRHFIVGIGALAQLA